MDPSDERTFPGISGLANELRSWEWTFGRTPKFSVHAPLSLHADNDSSSSSAVMEVKNGHIEHCEIQAPPDWLSAEACGEFCSLLIGRRFCPGDVAAAAASMMRTASASGDERGARRLGELCRSVASLM